MGLRNFLFLLILPQFRDALLEDSRDLLRVRSRWKFHGFADVDANAAGAIELAARFADFIRAVDAHRHDGNFQIAREQADAGAERLQFSVRRQIAFGKYKNVPAAIGQIPSKAEAFAKAGFFGQRETR